MNKDNSELQPLSGDPARQAIPALRGIAYQIWRTIERWITLGPEEVLYLECAEDFDVASADVTTAIQVKATKSKISLVSKDAREAILNFWQLQQRSPGTVRFQFLTRSRIAVEQGKLLNRRPGIEVWREAATGNTESCELLRKFLANTYEGEAKFKQYLDTRSSEELIEYFFSKLEWIMKEPGAEVIQGFIRERLIAHGERLECTPSLSSSVADTLYRHCWDVIQRNTPEERFLTKGEFLRLFEDATSVRVPITALIKASSAITGEVGAVSLAGVVGFWIEAIPPLPDPFMPREQAVSEAVAALSPTATLVLAGSAGMGKTTLAKLVALSTDRECLWADLSGRESSFTEAVFSKLALALADSAKAFLVVVDDFLIETSSSQAVWTSFGMLQRACRSSGSCVILTTKGVPPEQLDARLRSTGVNVQQIGNLSPPEIARFFEELGCPPHLSHQWASITYSQVNGHPKLVHFRALDLRDQNWPTPTNRDITETPKSIAGQRVHERLNAAERLSPPSYIFLNHLTMVAGSFDRQFALRLGSHIEGLPNPGIVLDSLVGRWIEPVLESHFRVTSLLTNAALDDWPSLTVQEAHGRIYDSFLQDTHINIGQVFFVFMHGFHSQRPGCLFPLLKALTEARGQDFSAIAKELNFVVYFGQGVGARAIPYDIQVSLLFRPLQFRIASREMPQELARIANEWFWEVENMPRDGLPQSVEYFRVNMALWANAIALNTEGTLPPRIVIDAIMVLDDLSQHKALLTIPPTLKSDFGTDDIVTALFSFFDIRCRDIDYLDKLLDVLTTIPASIRSRMLAATQLPRLAHFHFLVDGAWVAESQKEEPDWAKAIRVLKRTRDVSKELNEAQLGLSAAKALSIIFDEYLEDREAAVNSIDEGRKLFGDAPLLDEQLASIHFNSGEYSSALTIWEKTLSVMEDTPSARGKSPFLFRNIAIAAGKTGDFERAARLFLMGRDSARYIELNHIAGGMLYDAAHAFFRAEKYRGMCGVMREGLTDLTGQPDPEAEFHRFALHKLAGHVVLWVKHEVIDLNSHPLDEPALGSCSNPNYDSGIKELPYSRWEVTIAHVVELEHWFGFPLETMVEFASTLQNSGLPSVEVKLALVELEQIFRHRSFDGLLDGIELLIISMERLRAQIRIKQDVIESFQGQIEDEDRLVIPTEHFLLCALTAHVLSGKKADTLIAKWKAADKDLYFMKYEQAINSMVHAISVIRDGVGHILRDGSRETFHRLVAAHLILTAKPVSPELSFYAQAFYITFLCKSNVQTALREILPMLCDSFTRTWEYHVSQPALLLTPRLSIPSIESAIGLQPDGPAKIRQILLAASAATGLRLPSQAITWLSDVENPYLCSAEPV